MSANTLETIDLDMNEIDALLAQARAALDADAYAKLEKLVHAYLTLTHLIEDKRTTIRRLRELLNFKSEKTRQVLQRAGVEPTGAPGTPEGAAPGSDPPKKEKAKGHGRHGAAAYRGAQPVAVAHARLHPGDPCPQPGCQGTVYEQRPQVIVRVRGQAPLGAQAYALQRLRCNLCGTVFTAPLPADIGTKKYDASAAAMIALLKYGSGLPFHRLEGLQGNLEIPLPASTQWDIVQEAAVALTPVYTALIHQAAQGDVLHNDDTGMKVLALLPGQTPGPPSGADPPDDVPPDRTGVFTSGIVATREGRKVALFFTGRRHAGENLEAVLRVRAAELHTPIQMCDALARNLPGELQVLVANCLAHGRRNFVELVTNFPAECRHVLEQLGKVYAVDAEAKANQLAPAARLALHQEESGPVMAALAAWFQDQLAQKKVEPNSSLGKAITYMQKHWQKLTRFLQVPGAPLDNNEVERALKMAIRHRKNSLFYKTSRGARTGDLFMSLIHTCQLAGVNAFEYLTALLENAPALAQCPQAWLPWNYREALAARDPA